MTEWTSPMAANLRVVTMGVSGSGKSLIGHMLAEMLGADFLDGDDLHPAANIEKMAVGQALTDADRGPWLREIGSRMASAPGPVVIACSALKRSYRNIIRQEASDTVFIHLTGSRDVLHARMSRRAEHFMPVTLLQSQLDTIEQLDADENGTDLDTSGPPDAIAAAAAHWLADGKKGILAMELREQRP
ncbi:gluconokinase [Arthrobacter oryzae]|uniref:gluconokinase n=1 Tax=Arthrobacter oryzae TaxID=409290 RepID=UPI00285643CA|nr:gluconokinase [Arthrobacter oryzae]MDR6507672.1 carbohydrate kinase (thermoresistant glucokinase family) [Arthrobacter oryzae]